MATSVAHGMIGISVYCIMRPMFHRINHVPLAAGTLVLMFMIANVPDLDMLISLAIYGDHRVLHGGFTHTLLFSILGAVMVWFIAWGRKYRMELALSVGMVLLSHAIVDMFTGPQLGFHKAHGVAIFWPFMDDRISPTVSLFKGINHSNILPGALFTALGELLMILPVLLLSTYFAVKKVTLDNTRLIAVDRWISVKKNQRIRS